MKSLSLVSSALMLPLFLLSGCIGDIDNRPVEMEVLRESRPVGDAKEFAVNLKLDVGQLEIAKVADDNLFSVDLQYDKQRYQPKFNFDSGDRASLRLEMNSHDGFNRGRGSDNDLTLRLNEKVPLELDITTGVS